jgi:hypothetical protein
VSPLLLVLDDAHWCDQRGQPRYRPRQLVLQFAAAEAVDLQFPLLAGLTAGHSNERGLAHPWLTVDHDRPAGAGTGFGAQLTKAGQLRFALEQRGGGLGCPMANRSRVSKTPFRRELSSVVAGRRPGCGIDGVRRGPERRGRDSNPRSGVAGLQFSRLAHSTALPPLHRARGADASDRLAGRLYAGGSSTLRRNRTGEVAEWLKALAC